MLMLLCLCVGCFVAGVMLSDKVKGMMSNLRNKLP